LHIKRLNDAHPQAPQLSFPLISFVGAVTGFIAGLLGIGGGLVAVPLLQRICRLPLRQCIASTAAMMCVTATVGSIVKCSTLHTLTDASGQSLNLSAVDALRLAAVLAPTAMLGGLFGAKLTHKLPLPIVRTAFILLMFWACIDMLELSSLAVKLFGHARQ
ncbi:MAG TPA: sulfite exporter TauE/SafE family protein, partial [Phycisphaerales bacterium]|nr:sulfite exporter TauE/SafE family protein [Phycisphaerales bacterium]